MTLSMLYNNLNQIKHKYLMAWFFYYLLLFIIIDQNYFLLWLVFILYVNIIIKIQNIIIIIISVIKMLFLAILKSPLLSNQFILSNNLAFILVLNLLIIKVM